MRCACGSYIEAVGDRKCPKCLLDLIELAMVDLKEEEDAIDRFIQVDVMHRALQERVQEIYLARVEAQLSTPESTAEERVEFACTVVRDCPDGLTKALAADRIRQFKIENK